MFNQTEPMLIAVYRDKLPFGWPDGAGLKLAGRNYKVFGRTGNTLVGRETFIMEGI